MPNNFDQEFLNIQYHDQPERHRYGGAFFEPPTPSTITPLATQAATVGTSEAPARGDHTHGITAIPGAAYSTDSAATGTLYTTTAAYIDGLIGAVFSVVNTSPITKIALISARARLDVYNIAAATKQWFSSIYAAYTTDGSTPSSYSAMSDAMGHPAMGALTSDYSHHTGWMFVSVPAGATLKVKTKLYLYAVDVNVQFAYQGLNSYAVIF